MSTPDQVRPTISFGRMQCGSRIAYAALGNGPALVMIPGWLSHITELWNHAPAVRAQSKLTAAHRLVWYDRLGCGLSDRQGFEVSLDNDVEQLETVMDHAGIERANLIGYGLGAPTAIAFAAKHPGRVQRMVLYSAFARGRMVMPEGRFETLKHLIRMDWSLGCRTLAALLIANGSAQDLDWFQRLQEKAADASMANQLLDYLWSIDVTDRLSMVRAPTLLVHDHADAAVPRRAADEVAALLPGAAMHVLEGQELAPFIHDSGMLVQMILAFVSGRSLSMLEPPKRRMAGLTRRERQLLQLAAYGAPNRQIAATLKIAVATVERHLTNIYTKLDARGRADAVMRAVSQGLISTASR